jgi:hypothetical protein
MALNTYGMKLIGFSCLGFALVFFHEVIFGIRKREDLESWNRKTLSIELILLTVLSVLFFMRSLLISFPFAEEVFILTVLLLIGNYVYIAQKSVRELWQSYRIPAYGLIFYYASLILFSVTFIVGILFPDKGAVMAVLGFLLLGAYVIIGLVYKGMIINGEDFSLFTYTSNLKNKTTIAFVAIIMIFSFYTFRDADLIPGMYSGDTPTGYLRLIQEAEAGQDNEESKVERYIEFKNQYEQFIEKYGH